MARKSPSAEALKLLYVRSGNECAFLNCEHPIFNDNGLYIAQLCHIRAANKGGQRFDINQIDEERSSVDNLLFMCHRHHKETDEEEKYTIDKLTEIKNNQESRFTEKGKEASREMIRQVQSEANFFWVRQSSKSFDLPDLKIEREFNNGTFDLLRELEEHIQTIKRYCELCAESESSEKMHSDLKELFNKLGLDIEKVNSIPYYENPFESRNWEMHNIGRPNFFSHISLCLDQLKVRMAEELLKTNPQNRQLLSLIDDFRKEFDDNYNNAYSVD